MLLITCTFFALPSLLWGEDKPTGQFSLSAANKYIWRGYEMSRNSLVLQPTVSVGYKGFNASLWGNLDLKPYAQGAGTDYSSEWNETDFTFSYTKAFTPVNLTVGYIYYSLAPLRRNLPDRPDAQDIFVSASFNTVLNPTLTVYKEVSHYKNWYLWAGLSHEFALNKFLSLRISGSVSYLLSTDENFYPEFDDNALPTTKKFKHFHDGTLSVSLPIKLSSLISLTPGVTYVFPLSKMAKNEMKGFALKGSLTPSDRESSFLVGSLTFGFSF
ncbi:MAG: hypothetical protein N2572_00820 [Syntrophales bacterium]|nr:hypothetical protein [Syntrophales bacterium]